MKERPILMTTESVRAMLEGRKTQTRRVITPQPELLYGVYDDIIQLHHNRRAEDDQADIKADTNFTKRQLYGWERWQDILTDKIQGVWEEGFRGVVSISRLQDREEGVFSCLLMPRPQASNNVTSSASMYGFPRYAPSKVNAGETFGWKPTKQQTRKSQMGNSIRELDGSAIPQREQSQLQQPQLKNYKTRERVYSLGSKEQNRQQETYSKGIRDKSTFHIRNMPWHISQRLWVRETWRTLGSLDTLAPCELNRETSPIFFEADWGRKKGMHRSGEDDIIFDIGKKRPSIFMPRWASRIDRIITLLRVERLLDISEADARAEGFNSIDEFLAYWDILNKKRGDGTDKNPYNWVIGL